MDSWERTKTTTPKKVSQHDWNTLTNRCNKCGQYIYATSAPSNCVVFTVSNKADKSNDRFKDD